MERYTPMERHHDLVELARLCWRRAQMASTTEIARTLRNMATEYVEDAAKLYDGKFHDIGQDKGLPV